MHLVDARDPLGEVLDHSLDVALVDGTGERHLTVLHAHLDLAGVDVGVASELLVDLFLDALIGTAVSFWAAPDVRLSASLLTVLAAVLAAGERSGALPGIRAA